MSIPFIKMQGIGNDFVVIDDLGKPEALTQKLDAELARRICDRRFGVGCDQILWLRDPRDPSLDARMEILNADGSVAEMCGNGIRAVALYLYRHGPKRRPDYRIETLGGVKKVRVEGGEVTVDMGLPGLGRGLESARPAGERLEVGGRELTFFEVSMGNPHAVFFVDDVASFPVEELGPLVEKHPRFPQRTNVEFVQVEGPDAIRVRVWERGAGITLACGTGACGAAVAALATGRAQGKLEVRLPGGRLRIAWEGPGKPVLMEGAAEEVFRGEYYV